eukprot:m.129691 g.129691  ORF g.129691 m.129691 type:complete len:651 (+) comp15857_c0_seq1:3-1955(+)
MIVVPLQLLLCGSLLVSASINSVEELKQQWSEGMLAFQAGKLNKAERIFKQLAKDVPSIPNPLTNLGVVYEKQGNMKAARKVLLKALKNFPEDHEVAITTCRFGATALNRKVYDTLTQAELLKACKRAHELKPDDFESITLLGSTYVLLMNFVEAVKVLEQAVELVEGTDNKEGHRQVLTNLALANLRGARPIQALEVTDELASLYGHLPGMDGMVAGVRSIVIRYDAESVELYKRSVQAWSREFKVKDATCSSGKWQVVSNWTTVKHHNLEVKQFNPSTALTTYGAADLVVQIGKQPYDDMRSQFWERLLVQVKLHDAYLWSSVGLITMDCRLFTGSVSWDTEVSGMEQAEPRFIKTIEIDDEVALTLPLKNIGNYYHWMCEGLLRVIWLQERVLDLPGNEDIKLVIPPKSSFITQSLDLLHIEPSRLLEYPADVNVRWHFNKPAHIVDWIQPEDEPFGSLKEDTWSPYSPPREGLILARQRLQGALLEHDPNLFQHDWTVIYISRESGKSTRSISNEPALIGALKKQFGDDKVVVHTGKETLAQQLTKFVRARVVVGAHGAGLSNTMVCQPHTGVVMLPMKPMVDMTFVHMAAALQHKLFLATDVTSYYYSVYGELTKFQISQVVEATKEAVAWTQDRWQSSMVHDEL